MTRRSSRRDFLKYSAAAGAGFWVAGGIQGAQNRPGPNDRLSIGIIGAGGQGGGNLSRVASSENIVALCDVDEQRAGKAFAQYPKATRYSDFRVMLEKQKNIDAVIVSTPDHNHAPASIMAMRMGKHCYCEKPLTHSVYEARLMREVAAKHKVATQMGNQGTSSNGLREAVEIIRAGTLGDIREVHVWTNRPGMFWKQGLDRPKDTPAVPKTLNWDLWLGPAPERPYHPSYVPFAWRGWWDFGTGALGDMACHTMNLAYLALRLGAPTSVEASVDGRVTRESPPNGCTVTYEFAARPQMPAVRLMWYEVRRPSAELLHGQKMVSSGCVFVGAKGKLYSPDDYGARYVLLPQENFKGFKPPQPTLPRNKGGHHREWLDACKGGPAAMSNFIDHAGPLTEAVLLGNVAMRVGKRVVWNADKLQATGLPEADPFIRREYRKGWTL